MFLTAAVVALGSIGVIASALRYRWRCSWRNAIDRLCTAPPSEPFKKKKLAPPIERLVGMQSEDPVKMPAFIEVLQEGTLYMSPGSKGMRISARQIFMTGAPGFVWNAKGSLPMPFFARDEYICGAGKMAVSIAGILPIGQTSGREMDESSLVRYAAEAVLFPKALADPSLVEWKGCDSKCAEALIRHLNAQSFITFEFGRDGNVAKAKGIRYRKENAMMIKRQWWGTYGNYRQLDGHTIPTSMEGWWETDAGPFKYIDMKITGIKEWRDCD